MDAVEDVRFGQIVTLGEPNEGPLVAPLQKFGLVLERARKGHLGLLMDGSLEAASCLTHQAVRTDVP
jgi:hypothetical protein